jgi:phage tail protein X
MDEIAYAVSKGKHIFPILYRDCDIPYRLARVQYVDFRRNFQAGIDRLLEEMRIVGELKRGEETPKVAGSVTTEPIPPKREPELTQELIVEAEHEETETEKEGKPVKKVPTFAWAIGAALVIIILIFVMMIMNGNSPKVVDVKQTSNNIGLPALPTNTLEGISKPTDSIVSNTRSTESMGTPAGHTESAEPSPRPIDTTEAPPIPTKTFEPSPTLDPVSSLGLCTTNLPPCDYLVVPNDSFTLIATKMYGRDSMTPLLLNANRNADGYRPSLRPGDLVFIPDPAFLIEDLARAQYQPCGPNVFPCWYKAVSRDTYESIANTFYGSLNGVQAIQKANWDFDDSQSNPLIVPEIVQDLLLVLPVIR